MKKVSLIALALLAQTASAKQCYNFLVGQEPEVVLVKDANIAQFSGFCLEETQATYFYAKRGEKPYVTEGRLSRDGLSFDARSGIALIQNITLKVTDARMGTCSVTIRPHRMGGTSVTSNAIALQ